MRKELNLLETDEISGKGGIDKPKKIASSLKDEDLVKLSELPKVKIVCIETGELESLTKEQIRLIEVGAEGEKSIRCQFLKKLANLNEETKVVLLSKKDNKARILFRRPFSYELLKKLGLEQDPIKYWGLIDSIAYINSKFKSDESRKEAYDKQEEICCLTEDQKKILLTVECSGYGNLCLTAIKKLISYFEQGLKYTESCSQAGFKLPEFQKMIKLKYNELKEIEDVTSPVVKRAISQTIKVVNAIIDKYGSPTAIFIELAREMGKDFSERGKIQKNNEEHQKNNDSIKEKLHELGIINPQPRDIVKYKLYEEQGGKCAYSGRSFTNVFGSIAEVFKNNNTQIDHIIPFSKCYDDSYNNKVLVMADENANKGNRLPYEYMSNNPQKWASYEAFCKTYYSTNPKKMSNALKRSLSDEEVQQLNTRALNDTRYIAVFMKDLFVNHLIFAESKKFEKKPVRTVNGAMTSFLRKVWGLPKQRFLDDKHHAVDSAIIACTDDGMVRRVSLFLQHNKEINQKFIHKLDIKSNDMTERKCMSYSDVLERYGEQFQMPYDTFKCELEQKIENVTVSRMVNHKVVGKMHADTVRSKKLMDLNANKLIVVTKTKIQNLKLGKDGEIENYPTQFKESDKYLYEALRNRLKEFGGDGSKAFAEPFYKPTKEGSKSTPNQVKTVKLQSTVNDGVEVNGGFAENASMVRIDVFEKNKKFFVIPVYVADVYRQKLPNKIAKASKPYKDWPELDESYAFKFSLRKNDLIKLRKGNPIKFVPCDKKVEKVAVEKDDLFVYYNSFGRATSSIKIETVDGRYMSESVGIQNLDVFDKYEIDILGNISKAGVEKRKEFVLKKKIYKKGNE